MDGIVTYLLQPYRLTLVLLITGLIVAVNASTEETSSPDEVIKKSINMLNDDCDFDCCYTVAGLYTQRFLKVVREATLASLKANPDVNTVIRRGFGGKANTLEDVEAFTPRELFAWHTCDTIIRMPAKYRYSQVEILDVRHISPDMIEFVVRLSGVKAVPSTKEEAFYRVVRENGQWRIDQ